MSLEYYVELEKIMPLTIKIVQHLKNHQQKYSVDQVAKNFGLIFEENKINEKRGFLGKIKPMISYDKDKKIILIDNPSEKDDLFQSNTNYLKAYALAKYIENKQKKKDKNFDIILEDFKKELNEHVNHTHLLARNIILPTVLLYGVKNKPDYEDYLHQEYKMSKKIIKRQLSDHEALFQIQKDLKKYYQGYSSTKKYKRDDSDDLIDFLDFAVTTTIKAKTFGIL